MAESSQCAVFDPREAPSSAPHLESRTDYMLSEGDRSPPGTLRVGFTLNGRPASIDVEPNVVLLDALRDRFSLTGTHKGCDHGQCGACTVHLDGRAVNACLILAASVDGARVTTIEGLAASHQGEGLHPLQRAFHQCDAYQCGYCTSGQIMSAAALIADERVPSDDASVREAMSGNICRCGAYKNILRAIRTARAELGVGRA